jgi:hypothetical protein
LRRKGINHFTKKIKSEKGMDSNNNYHKWHKKPYHICTICKVVRFAALLVQQRSCLLMGAGVKQEGVKKWQTFAMR